MGESAFVSGREPCVAPLSASQLARRLGIFSNIVDREEDTMAWWGRRGFSSALRWTAVTTAGVAGIAGVQALALHARYDPLPDARGPTRGVASPNGRSRTDRVHGAPSLAAREALMKARDEAREFFET